MLASFAPLKPAMTMSKPPCGLWGNTAGALSFYGDAEAIIAGRVACLDLQEHPIREKQLSSASRDRIKRRIDSRTATREEWKRYVWDKRLAKRRNDGVRAFWNDERRRLVEGEKGTRNWTSAQRNEILNGDSPSYNGKKMQGHHTYSVSKYPHLANKAEVIYPATSYEHLKGWHGGSYRKSLPGVRIRRINEF